MVAMVAITWGQSLCRGFGSVLRLCVSNRATGSALGRRLFSFIADQSVLQVTNSACFCTAPGVLDAILIDYMLARLLLALQSVLMLLKTQHDCFQAAVTLAKVLKH